MKFKFTAVVFEWRGPSPFYFVATPDEVSAQIHEVKRELTYGWGVMHAQLEVSGQSVKTALIPKDGGFYVPLKDAIRKPNHLVVGSKVEIVLVL